MSSRVGRFRLSNSVLLGAVLATGVVQASPIAHYTFDTTDGGGTTTPDEVGSAFATLGGRVQINTTVPGRIGAGALEMLGGGITTGPGDGAVTSNSFAWPSDERTVTLWWRADSPNVDTTDGTFVSFGDLTGNGTRFDIKEQGASNTELRVEVQGTGQNTNPGIDDGEWHFIAVTVPGSATFADVVWYVDGLGTNLNTSGNTLEIATGTGPISFGDSILTAGTNDRVPNGYLDDVQVYDRVLTEAEILFLFNNPGSTTDDNKQLIAPIEFSEDDQFGFDLWPGTLAGTNSSIGFTTDPVLTSGTTTVSITASTTLAKSLNRGSVNGTPPGYTYQNLYEDLLIATGPTGFLTIDVSGLNAEEDYRFTLYSWDPGSIATDDKVWTVTGGTGVPASASVNYADPLLDNETFAMVFDITTDGSGAFQLTNTAGLEQSAINGFILEALADAGGGNGFSDWIAGFPGVGGQTGFDQDPDGDGLDSGVENFFGTDPSTFSEGIEVTEVSPGIFTFVHPRNAMPADDLAASYTWSKTLVPPFNADGATDGTGTKVDFTTQADTPSAGLTTVTATVSGTATPELYVRVEVTQN